MVAASFDAVIDDAVDALSPEFREAIELVDVGGLTYAEAAEVAGVPEGTVMSRLHRGPTRVRARLDAKGISRGRTP